MFKKVLIHTRRSMKLIIIIAVSLLFTTFFRLLAVKDEWFSDDLRKLDDDNVYRKLQGHWTVSYTHLDVYKRQYLLRFLIASYSSVREWS